MRSGAEFFFWCKLNRKAESSTNLFTNCGETVQEPDCVHNKLIEMGNDSSLLNSRDLKATQIGRNQGSEEMKSFTTPQ